MAVATLIFEQCGYPYAFKSAGVFSLSLQIICLEDRKLANLCKGE